eukprot:6476806-Amphidinium_carterae.1
MGLSASMELSDVLMQLEAQGKRQVWLYAQLLHEVGAAMETHLLRDLHSESKGTDAPAEPVPIESLLVQRHCFGKRHGSERRRKSLKLSAITLASGPRQMLKYFLAMRQQFSKAPVIHLAADASR